MAGLQAGLYLSTGIWPVAHRRSFESVTGRKTDFWLAQTVGATVAAIGLGLAQAAWRRQGVAPEVRTIGVASAAGLALVDVIFVARRRISPVYLLDAVVETALVLGWAVAESGPAAAGAP